MVDGYIVNVSGELDYDVRITLKDGDIEKMSCTYPYAERGENCKHMDAVLFADENELEYVNY